MLGQWHPPPTPSNQRLNRALRVYAPLSSHQYQKTAGRNQKQWKRRSSTVPAASWEGSTAPCAVATLPLPSLFLQHHGRVPQHQVPWLRSRCVITLLRSRGAPQHRVLWIPPTVTMLTTVHRYTRQRPHWRGYATQALCERTMGQLRPRTTMQ